MKEKRKTENEREIERRYVRGRRREMPLDSSVLPPSKDIEPGTEVGPSYNNLYPDIAQLEALFTIFLFVIVFRF